MIKSYLHSQRSQFPSEIRRNISVIHEGIDVSALRAIKIVLLRSQFLGQINDPNAEHLLMSVEVSSEVSRRLCIHCSLQAIRPHVHVLIAGSDVVAYGNNRSDEKPGRSGPTEVGLDPRRTIGWVLCKKMHTTISWLLATSTSISQSHLF